MREGALKLKKLVGSGHKLGLFTLPFLAAGITLNVLFPERFYAGGPPDLLKYISIAILVPGVVIWLWSVVLILIEVPKGKLITRGPFALVRHPLYTGVSLLVLPWAGFLLNTWLGVALGIVLYTASRLFAPEEEKALAQAFGERWQAYTKKVLLPRV